MGKSVNISSFNMYAWLPTPRMHHLPDGNFAFVTSTTGPAYAVKTDAMGNATLAREILSNLADVEDGGNEKLMVLGNGPVMGVADVPTMNPQIGLSLCDTTALTPDCINAVNISTTSMTFTLSPVTFTVAPAGFAYAPVLTSAGSASLSIFDGCVAVWGKVDEKKGISDAFVVSPNPSCGLVRIGDREPSKTGPFSVEILNWNGTRVFSSRDASGSVTADLRSLARGLYLVRISCEAGILSKKIELCR